MWLRHIGHPFVKQQKKALRPVAGFGDWLNPHRATTEKKVIKPCLASLTKSQTFRGMRRASLGQARLTEPTVATYPQGDDRTWPGGPLRSVGSLHCGAVTPGLLF